jgi:hypothetical protein
VAFLDLAQVLSTFIDGRWLISGQGALGAIFITGNRIRQAPFQMDELGTLTRLAFTASIDTGLTSFQVGHRDGAMPLALTLPPRGCQETRGGRVIKDTL